MNLSVIEENVSLAPLTTFGIGGAARYFIRAATESIVLEAIEIAQNKKVPLFVLGGGSNLLVSDNGFPGLVLKIGIAGIDWEPAKDEVIVTAGAAEEWDRLVGLCVERDLAGVECLSGIPGSVGGTPVQNVGAYGQEVSESLLSVHAYDRFAEKIVELTHADCHFSYRASVFNTTARDRYIVLRVRYRLTRGGPPAIRYPDVRRAFEGDERQRMQARQGAAIDKNERQRMQARQGAAIDKNERQRMQARQGAAINKNERQRMQARQGAAINRKVEDPSLADVRKAVREIRASKAMLLTPGDPDCRSAGSFFKNPIVSENTFLAIEASAAGERVPRYPASSGKVKIAAAWLIEHSGFKKGYTLGRAGLSQKHTLALVNKGGATAADILRVAREIRSRVRDRFGVLLVPEPVFVGFEEDVIREFFHAS